MFLKLNLSKNGPDLPRTGSPDVPADMPGLTDLQESEERFRIIAEESGQVVYDYDTQTGVIVWSGAIFNCTGFTPEEFRKTDIRGWEKLIHPDDVRQTGEILKNAIDSHSHFHTVYRFRKKDGQFVTMDDNGVFRKNHHGVYHMIGTMKDVTKDKLREEKLLQMQNAVDSSGSAVFMTDLAGIITYINQEFTNLYGFTAAEVVGKCTPRILKSGMMKHPEYVEFWQAILAKKTIRREITNKTKTGKIITVRVSINPVLSENGDISGFLSIQSDVSEVKAALISLEESENRLRTFFENAAEAVCLSDEKGLISEWNPQMEKLTGYSYSETVGRDFFDLMFGFIPRQKRNPVIRIAMQISFGRVMKNGDMGKVHMSEQMELERKDGKIVRIRQNSFTIKTKNGYRLGLVALDITAEFDTQRKFKEIAERYQMLFDNAPNGFYIMDEKGVVIDGNRKAEEIIGYKKAELVGKSVLSHPLLDNANKLKVINHIRQLYSGKSASQTAEYQLISKSGQVVPVEINTKLSTIDSRKVILGQIIEIAQRKKIESAIAEKEKILQKVIDSDPALIFMKDPSGKYMIANQALLNFLDIKPEQLIGKTDQELTDCGILPKYQTERVISQDKKVRTTGDTLDIPEETIENSKGRIRWVQKSKIPLTINGINGYVLCVAVDITDRKKAVEIIRIERDLSAILSNQTDKKDAFRQFMDVFMTLEGIDCGGIYLVNDQGGVDLIISRGLSEEFVDCVKSYGPDSPNVKLAREGKIIYQSADKLNVQNIPEIIREGLKALLIIPVFNENKLIGIINLSSHKYFEISQVIQDIVLSIVAQFGEYMSRILIRDLLLTKEKYFLTIMEGSLDIVAVVDPEGVLEFETTSVKRILGFSPDEHLNRKILDFIHPDDKEKVLNVLKDCFGKPNETHNVICRYRHQNGSWIVLESVGKAFLVDPAHPKIIINSRDITDRQKLELEISKTSELYKKVVNTSPDAILTYTLDGIATFVSDVFLQMFGYQSSDELVGKSVFSLVSPKDRDRAALNTQKAIPLGGLKNIEYELVRKDGTTFIANVNALILRDNHGNPEGLIAVISDITESKKSQEAVKSHELLLRSVIDSVNAGIFIRDKFSTYLMVNQMFASFTGNKPEDFVGKNDADFVKMGIYTQQDADRIQSEEKKVWEGHETLNIKEESVIRKDGSTSWFQTQKSPIEVAGHGTCVLGVILDITSRKNDEEQLKIRNQELEKLNKVMVGREVRMMELKKEIAGLRSTG